MVHNVGFRIYTPFCKLTLRTNTQSTTHLKEQSPPPPPHTHFIWVVIGAGVDVKLIYLTLWYAIWARKLGLSTLITIIFPKILHNCVSNLQLPFACNFITGGSFPGTNKTALNIIFSVTNWKKSCLTRIVNRHISSPTLHFNPTLFVVPCKIMVG